MLLVLGRIETWKYVQIGIIALIDAEQDIWIVGNMEYKSLYS